MKILSSPLYQLILLVFIAFTMNCLALINDTNAPDSFDVMETDIIFSTLKLEADNTELGLFFDGESKLKSAHIEVVAQDDCVSFTGFAVNESAASNGRLAVFTNTNNPSRIIIDIVILGSGFSITEKIEIGMIQLSCNNEGIIYADNEHTVFRTVNNEDISLVERVDVNVTPSAWEEFGIQYVIIPSGSFRMGDIFGGGSSGERPAHNVSITSFVMGMYEVTQEQYKCVMGDNPTISYGVGANYPVYYVSWHDAVKFCNALSIQAGLTPCYNESNWECNFSADGFRLPTEAEWEYACRAGTETIYYSGNEENDLARAGYYYGNYEGRSSIVGQKEPNAFGLYDMHGNVWEWCNDWYDGQYYVSSPVNDPPGPASGSDRIFRGGSWICNPGDCQSAHREGDPPWYLKFDIGFRIVRRP